MSKIKNDGLDQYGAEPFEQQQFVTAGAEGVKSLGHLTGNGRKKLVIGVVAGVVRVIYFKQALILCCLFLAFSV